MPTTTPFQNNFTAGELSPQLNARVDVKQYRNGSRVMTNAIPALEGGFDGRPGTQFLFKHRNEAEIALLIDFVFSTDQAYTLVLNDDKMWFINERAILTETPITITDAIGSGGTIRVKSVAHGLTTGDSVFISGVEGTVEANDTWQITTAGLDDFDLDGSAFTNTYLQNGTAGKIIELSIPWTDADLPNVRWTQDGDNLFLVDGTHVPYKLSRITATSFTLAKFFPHGPYNESGAAVYQTSAVTMNWGSATLAVGTIASMVASAPTFLATDVDRIMKYEAVAGGIQGYVKLTVFNSTTDMTAEVLETLSGTTATIKWSFGKWGGTAGWPRALTFHEQRLVMASTVSFPQTFWGSFLNDPTNFERQAINNDDSYEYTVRTERINTIKWVASALGAMIIGTNGEELKVTGVNELTIGPVNSPNIRPQTKIGSGDVRPLVIDDVVIFIQWGGRRVWTVEFNIEKEQLSGQDLSFISRHLIPVGTSLKRMAHEEQPNEVIWMVRSDGVMLSMVFFPEQEVLAWSSHTTENGLFEDAVSTPSFTRGIHDTYISVKRTVNGATRRYIEVFNRDLNVDSGLSGTFASPQTIINGLNHLIGETVAVGIDGGSGNPELVNSDGQIDLSTQGESATTIQAGLAFMPTVTPLEPPIDTQGGAEHAFLGRKKKYGPVIIRTTNTKTITVNGGQADRTLPAREAGDLMDAVPPTAELEDWSINTLGYKVHSSITITQPLPLPIHVLAIAGTMTVGEK
jgi:hypothetical protein